MTTWRESLKAGDPVASEPGLDPETTGRMRAMVLQVERRTVDRRDWVLPLALAAALMGVTAAGVLAIQREVPVGAEPAEGGASADPREVRQLQFATPGGTRVFWVFDKAR